MINTAAMVGLGNDPAYNQLKDINKSIQELFRLKNTDSKAETKHLAQEREKDKRAKQDADTIIGKQDANVAEFKTILKDPDMGIMGAIVSAAGLAGALMVLNKIDVKKFVGGIWEGVKERLPELKPGTTEESPSTDAPPSAATKPDGSPDMSEETDKEGGADNLSGADPNFKGLPIPAGAEVTSTIKMRWGKPHCGYDIAAPTGTPLTVSKPARIVDIGSEGPGKGYGNWIVVKDTLGEHIYAHLSKYGKYKKGQSVKPGDHVAYVGNTGRSYGAHLHWEFDTRPDRVGNPRKKGLADVMDPLKHGYKWSSPITGLQSGGMVGLPGRPDPISIKNPITLPAQHQSGGQVQYLMQEGGPLSIINQITEQQGPNIMMKGAQPMSESGRNVKSPAKPTINLPQIRQLKLPSFTYQMPRLKFQKGGEARFDKGKTKGRYMQPNEQPFKASGRRQMMTDKLPVTPKQVDPMLRPKFEAQTKGAGKPVDKRQSGGVVRLKRGGQAPSVGTKFIAPMEAANQLLKQHYTNQFFVRQARKKTGSQIIIVNKVVSGGGGQPPAPGGNYRSSRRDQTVEMPSYQDLSTNFNRFISGIRV